MRNRRLALLLLNTDLHYGMIRISYFTNEYIGEEEYVYNYTIEYVLKWEGSSTYLIGIDNFNYFSY